MTADLAGSGLVAGLAEQLGSAREARWILDHAGADGWQELVDRRLGGEPLQYVLGTWPFRALELMVDRRVLIPRPETEQVVDVALRELRRQVRDAGPDRPRGDPFRCVDLGTGSGAIALSLAAEGRAGRHGLEVWATDDSAEALVVARHNLGALAPPARRAVRLARGPWFGALPARLAGGVDLVVSNPPYVPEEDFAGLDPEVRDWEPPHALVSAHSSGGVPGMASIETILLEAPGWLRPGGTVVIELDPRQAPAALTAARAAGLGRTGVACRPGRQGTCPGSRQVTDLPRLVDPSSTGAACAGDALASGGVVAVPTDTVYGLAAHPLHPGALARLFSLKDRPADVAVPVLVADTAQVAEVAGELEAAAALLAARHWPGGLTLVVPRAAGFRVDLGGPPSAASTVALRWPDHELVQTLCRRVGPLAVTSANRHGAPPASTAGEVLEAFAGRDGLVAVVDGGRCDGVASTVVECQGSSARCVRDGAIPWRELARSAEETDGYDGRPSAVRFDPGPRRG